MRIACSGGVVRADRRVPLINIKYTRGIYDRMRARLHAEGHARTRFTYDESRHVGKFQADHRPQALQQPKGAWPRVTVFCQIYGAPSVTTLLQDAARVSHEYVYMSDAFPPRFDSASIIERERETARAQCVARTKWHTRDPLVVYTVRRIRIALSVEIYRWMIA